MHVTASYHRFPVREELIAPKSPLDPARAASAIEGASDRQQVFDLLLRATRSKLRFAALLSVHPDHIRGRSAIADDGFSVGGIDTLRIPRNTVPIERHWRRLDSHGGRIHLATIIVEHAIPAGHFPS